eukprot:1830133-Pyramimonas_sp.AAC.2
MAHCATGDSQAKAGDGLPEGRHEQAEHVEVRGEGKDSGARARVVTGGNPDEVYGAIPGPPTGAAGAAGEKTSRV